MSDIKSTEKAKQEILERIAAKINAQKNEVQGSVRHAAHFSTKTKHGSRYH